MRHIYKYELEVTDRQKVMMHKKAELLSVGIQHGKVVLWALIDGDNPIIEREIHTVGTGHIVNVPYGTKYVGTYMLEDGYFVGHVFG
jgi:hypothetical protein